MAAQSCNRSGDTLLVLSLILAILRVKLEWISKTLHGDRFQMTYLSTRFK